MVNILLFGDVQFFLIKIIYFHFEIEKNDFAKLGIAKLGKIDFQIKI